MGDRNNPIKFGPEWLRNLSRERSTGGTSTNQNVATSSSAASSGASGSSGGAVGGSSASGTHTNISTTNTPPKVQLAKLRYGREEMLALYDRTSEAPPELKYIDVLYQPRGKPPVALNNTFEDEMRETLRAGPPIGGVSPNERFGIGRGRGLNVSDGRGRPRIPFVRQQSTGRGASWHLSSPRMPSYSGADDDSSSTLRSWSSGNTTNTPVRNSGDLSEWSQNKMFRSKRPGNNTNWRQPTRDDGDEWRSPEASRSRSSQQDKWDRDWGDKPGQDKSPSWNNNRRTWVGGDSHNNDDNLPEWADSAEACTGTFDSSGAFHGYSNDDTNLPKSQESSYPLTRSHTHGSFVRSKTAEEGSEEWWASEKAKKLSPKRFDASEIKFKKPSVPDVTSAASSNTKQHTSKEETALNKGEEHQDTSVTSEPPENTSLEEVYDSKRNVRFAESKTFDALMRSDINLEDTADDRGNFQSVMITPNNSLRQKHQNIVSSINNNSNRQNRKPGIFQLLQNSTTSQSSESEITKQHQMPEDKVVEDLNIMEMSLDDKDLRQKMSVANDGLLLNTVTSAMTPGLSTVVKTMPAMPNPAMQLRMTSPGLSNQAIGMNTKSNMSTSGIPNVGGMQPIGITNSALNASLGLPLGPPNNTMGQAMGIPIQGVPPPILPPQGIAPPNMGASALQGAGSGIPSNNIQGMSSANLANSSMYIGQNTNSAPLQPSSEMQMQNHGSQTNMFPMHGLPQHSGNPAVFGSSMYGNIMPPNPAPSSSNQNLADQWYYEDPKKNIQGPFSSKEMYNWYRAGFFTSSLMVRRACDALMRPLGSYGPVVPFAQPMEMMYPMSSGFETRNQGTHDALLNPQQGGLGLDVMGMSTLTDTNSMESMQFGTVGLMRNPQFGQQQMVDSLWSQPAPSDLMWMQQAMNTRNEARVNNLPLFFWDQQPSAIAANPLLPDISKEMKTEDQILAQLRAKQNINPPQNLHYLNEPQTLPVSANKTEDVFVADVSATPNLVELQKLIQEDTLKDVASITESRLDNRDRQIKIEKGTEKKEEKNGIASKITIDTKIASQIKNETEKSNKIKDNTKNKNKKVKEEKKEELLDSKAKEEDNIKIEKKQEEKLFTKKKDEKPNKNEQKEWLKEGFTVVKTEKNGSKDSKKKAEEAKIADEIERKRKDEERLVAEEERKRKQAEIMKKQQEAQQQQRSNVELLSKKAPWSVVANQAMQAPNKDGLTLAEIQRLEREKKLEQMKEQQQMMQIIAQQQAAALAREQEMQAGLGWAKKKNANLPGQSLAEIQAETRKQAAAAATAAAAAVAAAAAQTLEEAQAAPPQINHAPWGTPHNGGGFWDTQPNQPQKQPVSPKIVDSNKNKKKVTVKDTSPAAEFELWCTTVLSSWSSKIDVPTFVGFLKDIESPYEVKDYVKCYLGESKDTNDFSRQFLERRSKLLRVGMSTPSDDLCSPAMAINPRSTSGSDYQEVKGKGKKTKKNKMLKVDARILGFSVTAAEDRINVGDIDTA